MKKVILTAFVSIGLSTLIHAQCCNVVSSNGVSAITSNGICAVTASGLGGDCGQEKPSDQDADGVADKDDVCPEIAGIVENKGCPAVSEDEKAILAIAIHGIHFETGSDVITEDSYEVLDKITKIMELKSFYKLSIEGHTDNSGESAFNLDLSKKRAAAVKKYFEDKGIDSSRLMAEGYGETKPVESNDTAEGMAANRRVDLKFKF